MDKARQDLNRQAGRVNYEGYIFNFNRELQRVTEDKERLRVFTACLISFLVYILINFLVYILHSCVHSAQLISCVHSA